MKFSGRLLKRDANASSAATENCINVATAGADIVTKENGNNNSHRSKTSCCCEKMKVFAKPLLEAKERFIESTSNAFEKFAYYVFDHPWRFIIFPTMFCLIFSLGFFVRERELDMDNLYSLPVSSTTIARSELSKIFPLERSSYVFAVSHNNTGLFSPAMFGQLNQLWSLILNLHVPESLIDEGSALSGNTVVSEWLLESAPEQITLPFVETEVNSSDITLERVCARQPATGRCRSMSPLDLYVSVGQWGQPIGVAEYPNFVNAKIGAAFRLDSFLGGIEKTEFPNRVMVTNATALAFRLDLLGAESARAAAATWEQALIALIQNVRVWGVDLYVRTDRSINDELSNSSQLKGMDLIMLLLASGLVLLFTVVMNSSCHWYRTKTIPALVGIATTLLAYGGGVGFWHLVGMKHVPPAEATPFMILGICVDDIFVVINAYALSYMHSEDPRTRIGLAIRDAGMSITITTLTNVVAFSIGATTVFYSIYVFCVLTATGLFVGYLLCLTVFLGALSLSARREAAYCRLQASAPTENTHRSCLLEMGEDVAHIVVCRNTSKIIVDDNLRCSDDAMPSNNTKVSSCSISTMGTEGRLGSCVTTSADATDGEQENVCFAPVRSDIGTDSGIRTDVSSVCLSNPVSLLLDDEENHHGHPVSLAPSLALSVLRNQSLQLIEIADDSGDDGGDDGDDDDDDGENLEIPNGIYSLEDLDNHLVVAERVRMTYRPAQSGMLVEELLQSAAWGTCKNMNTDRSGWPEQQTFNMSNVPRLVRKGEQLLLVSSLDLTEPGGTVGRHPRNCLMKYFGPFILHPVVKFVVMATFAVTVGLCAYGSTKLEAGLQLRDVTPFDSYLREFYNVREKYFSAYGDEVIVVFPEQAEWWRKDVQDSLLLVNSMLESSEHIDFVLNGMVEFLKEYRQENVDESIGSDTSPVPVKEAFMAAFEKWSQSTKGKLFSTMFAFEENNLKSIKFYYWMSYLDNTQISINRVQEVRSILSVAESTGLPKAYVFTPLAIHWESDLMIVKATITNVVAALLSMGVVACLLIPDCVSGFMVLGVIVMIDVCVMGVMPVLGLKVNMMTMVNLVLAIGFAVDYTAHITHCFTHCNGPTRNHRVMETLVLMGLPVTNGMVSTYGAVGVLAFSGKYILVVVFQMMTAVLAFAFLHGIVFMPVVLSLIGPMKQRNLTIVEVRKGRIVRCCVVKQDTGKSVAVKNMKL